VARKLMMFSIFDRKLREYGAPLVQRNEESMCRELRSMKGSLGMMDKYPEDFDLHVIGEYDAETGRVDVTDGRLLDNVRDILSQEE